MAMVDDDLPRKLKDEGIVRVVLECLLIYNFRDARRFEATHVVLLAYEIMHWNTNNYRLWSALSRLLQDLFPRFRTFFYSNMHGIHILFDVYINRVGQYPR
ncbi:uncharacterized protein H6S33_006832 [Morchella sextelata]|uniref:uncharacterized protein n=1 Tax=Morchella sextelata TaxID=1174677 RepID=UPI001D038088|nr:uncharacterized protein H6S33_006832 [Morchella sextelata]KAH0604455.1 hypothetical protein H6S33_006832 [Morchella sextelata]